MSEVTTRSLEGAGRGLQVERVYIDEWMDPPAGPFTSQEMPGLGPVMVKRRSNYSMRLVPAPAFPAEALEVE